MAFPKRISGPSGLLSEAEGQAKLWGVLNLFAEQKYAQEVRGRLAIASTDPNPYDLGLESILEASLFCLRTSASVKLLYTSAAVARTVRVSDLFLFHAPNAGDGITAVKLVGTADVSFLAAGPSA